MKYLLFVLLTVGLAGCNLPLAHGFADEVLPEEPVERAFAAPLVIPIYAALAGIDIVLVNPILGCIALPEEISRAWNEDANSPNQAVVITGKILVSPLYTIYLVGFIAFSQQFEKEESPNRHIIEVREDQPPVRQEFDSPPKKSEP